MHLPFPHIAEESRDSPYKSLSWAYIKSLEERLICCSENHLWEFSPQTYSREERRLLSKCDLIWLIIKFNEEKQSDLEFLKYHIHSFNELIPGLKLEIGCIHKMETIFRKTLWMLSCVFKAWKGKNSSNCLMLTACIFRYVCCIKITLAGIWDMPGVVLLYL